jgi:segregation and condensation protein A
LICTISLPEFEGPLDLLLYLVEKHEVDIYEVNVATVAQQYLAHLQALEELDIDLASEFYLMAVRLLAIKARALLPRALDESQSAATVVGDEDPQRSLIRELVAYRMCKVQAAALASLYTEQCRRYGRPPMMTDTGTEDVTPAHVGVAPSADVLAASYADSLARARRRQPRVIPADGSNVRQRMAQLLRSLRRADGILFSALRALAATRREVVVTFLALLELLRRRRVLVHQPEAFADFRIELPRRNKEASR